jgi:predicted nucleic acid-binding protein
MITHPRKNADAKLWLQRLVRAGVVVAVPEIADYEVRRELLRAKRPVGVTRLDTLKFSLRYLPITTDIMLASADLWAQMRNAGLPTAVDAALDGDVILCATARAAAVPDDDVVIATTNVRHLARMAPAKLWHEIT